MLVVAVASIFQNHSDCVHADQQGLFLTWAQSHSCQLHARFEIRSQQREKDPPDQKNAKKNVISRSQKWVRFGDPFLGPRLTPTIHFLLKARFEDPFLGPKTGQELGPKNNQKNEKRAKPVPEISTQESPGEDQPRLPEGRAKLDHVCTNLAFGWVSTWPYYCQSNAWQLKIQRSE